MDNVLERRKFVDNTYSNSNIFKTRAPEGSITIAIWSRWASTYSWPPHYDGNEDAHYPRLIPEAVEDFMMVLGREGGTGALTNRKLRGEHRGTGVLSSKKAGGKRYEENAPRNNLGSYD